MCLAVIVYSMLDVWGRGRGESEYDIVAQRTPSLIRSSGKVEKLFQSACFEESKYHLPNVSFDKTTLGKKSHIDVHFKKFVTLQ